MTFIGVVGPPLYAAVDVELTVQELKPSTRMKAVGTVPVCVNWIALLLVPGVHAGRPEVLLLDTQTADAFDETEAKKGTGCALVQFWAAVTAPAWVPPTWSH